MIKKPRLMRLIWAAIVLMLLSGCSSRYDGSEATPSPLPPSEQQAVDSSGNASGGIARPGLMTATPRQALQLGGGMHKYSMELELDEEGKTVSGSISIDYKNPAGRELANIYFHVYPNTFASQTTAPFFSEEMGDAYPNGFSPGGIELEQLRVDGVDCSYTLENEDDTLLNIALSNPLASGETAKVEMQFTTTLPNCLGRFGYGDKTFNICNFYPIAAAWNGSDFYKHPYYIAGDPFVSDTSDYEVKFQAPEDMEVAHTGSSTKETKDGITTYQITAPMVRDFAIVAGRNFNISVQKVNGVAVKSYYYKGMADAGKTAMRSAADAIKVYSKCFGQFPYDEFSVVQTDFFIGGMEYPGIVLIDKSMYDMDMMLEYVVVHETAHQWWYGVVGNDQVDEPWLDEALAEYSAMLYYGENYNSETEEAMYNILVEYSVSYYEELYGKDHKGVGESMRNFNNSEEYSYCIYINGNRMYHEIEQRIGRSTMKKTLSTYYKNNMYKRTTAGDLISTFNKESNDDLTPIFQKWLD